jgi:hypothetical protein
VVGKLLKSGICLVAAGLLGAPLAPAQVRNPDGEVGRAVFDIMQGWSRVTNPVMDSNGALTDLVLVYPHNETLSWLFTWNYTRQFEDNDNVLAAGLRYFSRPIGAGVDMNPDGATGSVVLDINVGYWRPNFSWHGPSLTDITKIVDYIGHGVHVSGRLAFPMMPHATFSIDGNVNVAKLDAFGIDQYRRYGGGGALKFYSTVLTYDDAQANPDGPIGSMSFEVGGGYRRVGGFHNGMAFGELGLPVATWATLFTRYEWQRGPDAKVRIWSAFFAPGRTWGTLQPSNNTSQLSFGFRFY